MSDGRPCLRCARNAWQRLGNMNPEEAMEQYVKLLSERVPGWMEEHCSVSLFLMHCQIMFSLVNSTSSTVWIIIRMPFSMQGDNKLESHKAGIPDAAAPELVSFSDHQTNFTHKRLFAELE